MWESIALCAAGGIYLWNGLMHSRERLQMWKDAASSCGFNIVKVSTPLAWRLKLAARAGLLEVRIEDRHAREFPTWVRVSGSAGFLGVKIRRQSDAPSAAREIEIGDEPFDSAFFVNGPLQLVCLLDAEVRHLMVRVNTVSRLEIADGELRVGMFDHDLRRLLPFLIDIAQRFAQHVDVAQRLAENAERDPVAEVRLQNLRLLIRERPKDPRTAEALRVACSDSDPEIRLRAARELGAGGHDVLLGLAESLEIDDSWSAQAIADLGSTIPFDRARAILVHALRRRRIETGRACLEALGRSGEAADVEMLAKVVEREQGELAAAAAVALGATGSAAAEPPLILALQHERTDVLVAAAKALGRVGSAAAVLPLKDLAGRSTHDPELRRATRQAIAEIQSRLQGASPGQLSLAGSEAGRLSLAQAEAGQLSISADPAGDLSLPV